mgnify:CR=1 FL=1|tara:strand:+ start:26471 stop:26974 length:504 start_codon:yes stop_codon:yes gene_type:complete
MAQTHLKLKRKHGSAIKGLITFLTQSHLVCFAKLANKDKTIGILFGRIRYCRHLFDGDMTKENYIRNWYLVRHSLDKLVVLIASMNNTQYVINLLSAVIKVYSESEQNIRSDMSEVHLENEWLTMKKSLSEILIMEPSESMDQAIQHLKKIQVDETQFFKLNYLKLF